MASKEQDQTVLWIQAAQNGDEAAFGQLVGLYQKKIFSFIISHVRVETEADILTQETFWAAWRGLKKFRGDSLFVTWLFRIALNQVRSWGRRQSLKKWREWPLFGGQQSSDDSFVAQDHEDTRVMDRPAEAVEQKALQRQFQSMVDRLPMQERNVFLLRHNHHLPLADIAQALNLASGTVKAHLFHALQKLKKDWEAQDHG